MAPQRSPSKDLSQR